jgi:hypothetical protein
MGAPGRDGKDVPRKDLMYSREDDGDNVGEETTMTRQYLLIPEKCSATNGYQRACRRTMVPFTCKAL